VQELCICNSQTVVDELPIVGPAPPNMRAR
jgi:hypothetical protein